MGADAGGNPDARNRDEERCPRCGYDLGGEIDAWRERCPLDGVCSECGLRFRWAELLNADLQRHPWLYEHARFLDARSLVTTIVRSLTPWSFWRDVRPHHCVVANRLAATYFVPFALYSALLWLCLSAVWILLELAARAGRTPMASYTHQASIIPIDAALFPLGAGWNPISSMISFDFSDGPLFLMGIYLSFTAFCALIALCTPSVWHGARTRARHILRIGAYTMTLPLIVYAFFAPLLAWDLVGHHYGSWFTPEWWQRNRLLPDSMLVYFAAPAIFLTPLWQTACWWFGFRRGLDMRWRDASILTAICFITGVLGSIVYVAHAEGM